jgi:hypothetical protein
MVELQVCNVTWITWSIEHYGERRMEDASMECVLVRLKSEIRCGLRKLGFNYGN